MSGKSTLVEALVRAGAGYASDEFAVIDRQGRVHPYPKSLSLRDEERPTIRVTRSFVDQVERRSMPVGLVVVTHYQAGARWAPEPTSRGHAILALLDNTVLARSRPAFALRTLTVAMGQAPTISSSRGDANQVATALVESWRRGGLRS
jgi:hypothetical protein